MTKRWSSAHSDPVTTKRAAPKAARRAKIDDDDTNMTDEINPAIEVVAREIFNEQFEGVSSYHEDNPVAVTWDNASPTLKVEYLYIIKSLILAFLNATEKPSALQVAEALEQHEIRGMNAALKASRRRLKQELGL